jgi:nitronate monooxygenase
LILDRLRHPIIQAPMGGGPSTPELAAAVSDAGGLGFLASGYKTAASMAEEIEATRALTDSPLGVNVFVPGEAADPDAYRSYVDELESEAAAQGARVGEPRYSDDDWPAKIEHLLEDPPAVVSFAFGCPESDTVRRLREAGTEVWITVTGTAEAGDAVGAGATALIVQGAEAGAHQGGFTDHDREPLGLLALLQLVSATVEVPLVATGGIATGAGLAAVLAAGASAAQVGTAFMLSPEAGTSEVHRQALASESPTALTRAFTGRRARGIVNRFIEVHEGAPSAYPEIHYATAPIRAAARERQDPGAINLWAGQAHVLASAEPAGEIVRSLSRDARKALADAAQEFERRDEAAERDSAR